MGRKLSPHRYCRHQSEACQNEATKSPKTTDIRYHQNNAAHEQQHGIGRNYNKDMIRFHRTGSHSSNRMDGDRDPSGVG